MPPSNAWSFRALLSRIRRGLTAVAMPASLLIGFGCVWLFAPSAFRSLNTLDLAVVLSLMALPGAAVWALALERRWAADHAHIHQHASGPQLASAVHLVNVNAGPVGLSAAASRPAAPRVASVDASEPVPAALIPDALTTIALEAALQAASAPARAPIGRTIRHPAAERAGEPVHRASA